MPSFLALRRAAFAIIVFFAITAIAQYLFVRAETIAIVERDTADDASQIDSEVDYHNGIDPSRYNKADVPGRCLIVLKTGELISYDTGFGPQSSYPRHLLPPVTLSVNAEGLFTVPTTVTNNSSELLKPERWTLLAKHLDRGYVVLGLSEFDSVDPAAQGKMLGQNLPYFGDTIEKALHVAQGKLDNDLSWAVIDDHGYILAGTGRIPLKTDPMEVGRVSTSSGLQEIEGQSYYVMYEPVADRKGQAIGTAILFSDTKTLSQALDHLIRFDVTIAALSAFVLLFATLMTQRKHEREKRAIREAFQNYFSPKVLEAILQEPAKLALGGQRREVTVLFSDIRSFTTLTERLPPRELTRLLQEYFDEMAEAVYATDGTLDKYIGDAVMAFWGAPIEQPDQADRAVRTALDMAKRLDKLREKWAKEGLPVLEIGIGINLGVATVGNFGSARRFDYTVIGDTVNAASRIESLTKDYNNHIIISQSTKDQLTIAVDAKDLGEVRVKGKDRPIRVFEVSPKP